MKIEIFQSSHGDCMLLESADGKLMLCDGGMSSSMIEYVAPELAERREQEPDRPVDLVYVSHIDADHIGGVLKLIQDLVDWEVWDHHQREDDDFAEPESARPPKVSAIWHNAFHDQVPENVGRIEDMLAAAAPVMFATQVPAGIRAGFEMQNVALGVDHAIQMTKLIRAGLPGVAVNRLPGSRRAEKLLMARARQRPIALGSFEIRIIGPTAKELQQLREGWNNWLRRSEVRVAEIERQVRRRVEAFASGEGPELREWEGIEDFRGVTIPNVASLVLLVQEGDKRILLTGDAQHDILLEQLGEAGLLQGGALHLDVLKIQHHGSENNMSPQFAQAVTADHYLFCGDGQSGNPEPEVVEQIYASRMSRDRAIRGRAPEAAGSRPFHFWFSTSTATPSHGTAATNFKEVARFVDRLAGRSNGRLTAHFNAGRSINFYPDDFNFEDG
ncbi:Metallo-beta-lactamase superfamily protein [Mesorhizobium albiziae]|uniref:Metallo-beta-lactamase superfamily protein n=1 Tax=Neomesorhizobium albiziae TaxID=335020 RepID=A0A1I4EK09_9HYPH|nr:MBL fold metallo-hydrolase [Mesorhizobium albiziae]GLS34392.1 hypothetical protein GCM10007937_61070 [Mesorhizobium albiziae]SFL06055.1 Metallo-beta-lactamase superfamily protein [Mesorhizobium albiziae]